jgi:ubiquinone/menaquinone biosynthesis C-methylase UbiE
MNRKAHWEQVYSNKSPLEVSWYQAKPTLSLQLIANTGLPLDATIIDLGGGASVLVDHLSALGYHNLTVLDISDKALTHAKARLGDKAKAITWLEADATDFKPPHQFDLWYDRAVFHFLTQEKDRRKYVATLKRALVPGGHLIIATFAIGGPQKCSGLNITQYDAEKITAELGDAFQLVEEAQEVHITPTKAEQQFSYFRFIRVC